MDVKLKSLSGIIRARKFEFDFTDKTQILGGGSSGKSTLLDAISWVLSGSPAGIKFVGIGDTSANVTLEVEIDGKLIKLTRTVSVRPSGVSTNLRVNNLNEGLGAVEKKLGLTGKAIKSMLNPMGFIMGTKSVRDEILLSFSTKSIILDGQEVKASEASKMIAIQKKTIDEVVAQRTGYYDEKAKLEMPDWFYDMLEECGDNWNVLLKNKLMEVAETGNTSVMNSFYRFCTEKMGRKSREEETERYEQSIKLCSAQIEYLMDNIKKLEALREDAITEVADKLIAYGLDIGNKGELLWMGTMPIDVCSSSEQLNAALAFSVAAAKITGVSLPIIIDGIERFEADLDAYDVQLITTELVPGMELSIARNDETAVAISDGKILRREKLSKVRKVVYV